MLRTFSWPWYKTFWICVLTLPFHSHRILIYEIKNFWFMSYLQLLNYIHLNFIRSKSCNGTNNCYSVQTLRLFFSKVVFWFLDHVWLTFIFMVRILWKVFCLLCNGFKSNVFCVQFLWISPFKLYSTLTLRLFNYFCEILLVNASKKIKQNYGHPNMIFENLYCDIVMLRSAASINSN